MIGRNSVSSRKYFSTVVPRCVTAKTIRSFLMVRFSTRPCLIRNSKYSLSMLQLTLALYMMCVNFNGPLRANTLRMSIYISSFDRLIFESFPSVNCIYLHIMWQSGISFCYLPLFNSSNCAFY